MLENTILRFKSPVKGLTAVTENDTMAISSLTAAEMKFLCSIKGKTRRK
jgi:hypothetical protein